uniref:AlNc14C210G8902 protein n=1 Tax=Albugo laibachii Nc14 TaxID=890382 RepID=F0WR95_9STRA|nr:AlNc14C210G8902 [Albugo laibachii Nc14]CCA24041.1 AlNc14C219G9071 [Albugo laibachii Nc14]|eukprot:CCA24041.1 AlNc14C219G9071 [Albugo laibachii Nc14]
MIIRAESDEDTDDHEHWREKYAHDDLVPERVNQQKSFFSKITIVRLAWLGIIFMMCFLALKDVEVIIAHLVNASSSTLRRDYVGFISHLIEMFQPSSAVPLPSGLYWSNVAGILFICLWIFMREKQNLRPARHQIIGNGALPYSAILGILFFGHFVSSLYIAMALYESQGNMSRFLCGRRRRTLLQFAYDAK